MSDSAPICEIRLGFDAGLEVFPKMPERSHPGDAGYDLFVSRYTIIPPRAVFNVHTDVYIAMPPSFWGHIVTRSSTMKKHGLRVIDGVIDNGFRGELFVQVDNGNSVPLNIPHGTRLAQIIFHRVEPVWWSVVGSLREGERGNNGFGSTGE